MKNLELLRVIPVLELDKTVNPFCLSIDCDGGIVYVATATWFVGFEASTHEVYCAVVVQVTLKTLKAGKMELSNQLHKQAMHLF